MAPRISRYFITPFGDVCYYGVMCVWVWSLEFWLLHVINSDDEPEDNPMC